MVRWPDGKELRCYSPSLVVRDHLEVGRSYAVAGFVERSRTLLTIAAERVRAKYGNYCSAAMDQLAEIEARAAGYDPAAPVAVVGFDLPRSRRSVAVIGGGQAGLAMSYCLKERGIDHFVFEKHRDRPRVARAALGLVLPRDPELAVPAPRLSVSRAPIRSAS